MLHTRSLFTVSALALGCLTACGSSNPPADTGTTTRPDGASPPIDGGSIPGADAATVSVDAARATDPDSPSTGVTIHELRPGQCFTFATATTMDAGGMRCGDIQAVMGLNVDVMAGGDFLCLLPGTFTSLDAVPRDYSSCTFTPFLPLEFDGLVDRGVIVAIPGAGGTDHYRVHVLTNRSPAMRFSFDRID
ncbi:MAG: hypothetical protein ACK6CU_04855 [Deltaproteobacteria bacterium]|jgi:hypothetical protein